DQRRDELRAPRVGTARAPLDTSPTISGTLPSGHRLVVTEAEIAGSGEDPQSGSLRVEASVEDEQGRASAALDTHPATLSLAWGGEIWPIAVSTVEGGRVRWELPGLGAESCLPHGPLPGRYLNIHVSAVSP